MKIRVGTFNLFQFVEPPFSWYTKKEKSRDQQHEMQTVINLALDLIEGYTEVL